MKDELKAPTLFVCKRSPRPRCPECDCKDYQNIEGKMVCWGCGFSKELWE